MEGLAATRRRVEAIVVNTAVHAGWAALAQPLITRIWSITTSRLAPAGAAALLEAMGNPALVGVVSRDNCPTIARLEISQRSVRPRPGVSCAGKAAEKRPGARITRVIRAPGCVALATDAYETTTSAAGATVTG